MAQLTSTDGLTGSRNVPAAKPPSRRSRPARLSWGLRSRPSSILDVVTVALVAAIVLIALIGPFFAPDVYASHIGQTKLAPSAQHWFGTDEQGRDVAWRIVVGARYTLHDRHHRRHRLLHRGRPGRDAGHGRADVARRHADAPDRRRAGVPRHPVRPRRDGGAGCRAPLGGDRFGADRLADDGATAPRHDARDDVAPVRRGRENPGSLESADDGASRPTELATTRCGSSGQATSATPCW